MDVFLHFLSSPTAERLLASSALIIVGGLLGWLGHRWRHYRSQRQILQGDARDVATIEKVLIHCDEDGRDHLRIRTCGRDPITQIFPNPAAQEEFHHRSVATTLAQPLVNKEGKMGSYLLQELAIWVCDKVGEEPFPHDVWVMVSVCEPASFGGHQSSTVLLIKKDDLALFRDWTRAREIFVEHGGHGERILTLLSVAKEFERQSEAVAKRQSAGLRPNYEETMYLLDLPLDPRTFALPTKPVPWTRFTQTLKLRGLEE